MVDYGVRQTNARMLLKFRRRARSRVVWCWSSASVPLTSFAAPQTRSYCSRLDVWGKLVSCDGGSNGIVTPAMLVHIRLYNCTYVR